MIWPNSSDLVAAVFCEQTELLYSNCQNLSSNFSKVSNMMFIYVYLLIRWYMMHPFFHTCIYSLAFLLYRTDPPNRSATGSREPCGDGGWSSQGVEAFDVTRMPKKPFKRLEMYSWQLYFLLFLLQDLTNGDIHAVRWIRHNMVRYVWFIWSIAWNYTYWDGHQCANGALQQCQSFVYRHDTAKPDQLGRFIPLFTDYLPRFFYTNLRWVFSKHQPVVTSRPLQESSRRSTFEACFCLDSGWWQTCHEDCNTPIISNYPFP